MMRARVRLAFPAAIVLASTLACPSLDDPSGAPRLPEPPTAATTPRPVVTATASTPAPTAAPATPTAPPVVAEPTRDPRGTRCMSCSNDSECRPPLRCFPFTDGRSRCDNANPGPPC